MFGKYKMLIQGLILSAVLKTMGEKKVSTLPKFFALILSHFVHLLLRHILNEFFKNYVFSRIIKSKALDKVFIPYQTKDNTLVIRYDELMDNFCQNHRSLIKKPTRKNIHQLRVAIKKIRAVLRLIERTSKGSFNKTEHFEMFSALFQSAGKVREAQVNGKLIKKYTDAEGLSYMNYLEDIESRAAEQLSEEARALNTLKLEVLNKELLKKARKVSDEDIRQEATKYISHNLKKVIQYSDDLQKLHTVRKIVRTISVVLKYLSYDPSGTYNEANLYYVVDKLNDMIGEWHDGQVLVDSIRSFMRQHDTNDCEIYSEIIQKVEDDRRRKEEAINLFMDANLKQSLITT